MPYTGSKAAVELGSSVSIGPLASATGSPTYTAIGEINEVEFSGSKGSVVKVTNMQSTAQEKVGTIPDLGQIKITANRVSTDAGQLAMIAAFQSFGTYLFEVQEPILPALGQTTAGNLYKFAGIVSDGPTFTLSPEKPSTVTFTIEITGAITFTAGS